MFPDGSHLAEPTNEELADKLGSSGWRCSTSTTWSIVGGGPAGLTTAIYAARENLETLVIDAKGLGGQAGVTERLDNYPGFPDGIGGAELADRFVRQAERYGVEMLQARVASTRSSDAGADELRVDTSTGDHYDARAVLIATGSTYRRTGAEGEDDLIGAGIHFCATCDGPFYKGAEELLVIGGGNSGLEEGLFLTQFADKVTVVEYKDRLARQPGAAGQGADDPKMEVLLERKVVGVHAQGRRQRQDRHGGARALTTGELEEHHPTGVFVFIGLDPNTGFLKGTVDLDERGFVDDRRDVLMTVDARRVRGRRRARRLDQTARERGGRGRRGRDPDPRLPRAQLRRPCTREAGRGDGSEGDLRADHQGRREAEVRDRRQRPASGRAGGRPARRRRATRPRRSGTSAGAAGGDAPRRSRRELRRGIRPVAEASGAAVALRVATAAPR